MPIPNEGYGDAPRDSWEIRSQLRVRAHESLPTVKDRRKIVMDDVEYPFTLEEAGMLLHRSPTTIMTKIKQHKLETWKMRSAKNNYRGNGRSWPIWYTVITASVLRQLRMIIHRY